ncbi:hypothetical protein EJ357_05325 [Streptomyces cyaneochromogenes]|uniref:Uncharacterized protein n=1 Tax=Streptomyces cyaneochromogenes TaxID=2496836 RepID=A0A3S9M172_9ACTN|nr:hypothetical protein EJ357_05325 [Streptomyces cyaneochromogenes]
MPEGRAACRAGGRTALARRRRRPAQLLVHAPLLHGEEPGDDRLVILEGERPGAWWPPGPGPGPRLAVLG